MDTAAIKTNSPAGWRAIGRPATLDRIEQIVIVVLWVWLVQRVVGAFAVNKDGWLLLISETSIMAFTLIRRPTKAIIDHLARPLAPPGGRAPVPTGPIANDQ